MPGYPSVDDRRARAGPDCGEIMTTETLTDLVASVLAPRGDDTIESLTLRCVDPETGYRPSRNTVWKISRSDLAEGVKINPKVVRAVAAGVGVSPRRATAAAAYQYTGYVPTEIGGGVALHPSDETPDNARAVLDRWDEEEERDQGQPSG